MRLPRIGAAAADHQRLLQGVGLTALGWGAVYLVWRALSTWEGSNPVAFSMLLAAEVFSWVTLFFFVFLAWRTPATTRPPVRLAATVDVFVCTYDEDLDILQSTLLGCNRITYPHATWLLDDGRRPEARELAEVMGAGYLTRDDNGHAKAGNVNHALTKTAGDLILVLDADHVPLPDVLDATVGYFDEPDVAVVQTPHDFSNLDSFQHFDTARHDQSLFFDVILRGKDRHNGAFWCGSAAVVRREALEEIGGVATDTIAEDFHTTIKLHKNHWRTRYHGETLVQGIAPHDLASFLLQRDRWARGNLAVFHTPENPVSCRGLSFKQRLSYLGSLLAYLTPVQRLAMVGVLVAMMLTGALPADATLLGFTTFWLPWALLAMLSSTLFARGRMSLVEESHGTWLTAGIFSRAALTIISPAISTFKVTPKVGIDRGGWSGVRQLPVPLLAISALLAGLIGRLLSQFGVVTLPHLSSLALGAGLFFTCWESLIIARTLTLVAKRRQLRRHYRAPVGVSASVDETLVKISDLTPYGMGLVSPKPWAEGSTVEVSAHLENLHGHRRNVSVELKVVSCQRRSDGLWKLGGPMMSVGGAEMDALVEYTQLVVALKRLGRLHTDQRRAPGDDAAVTALDRRRDLGRTPAGVRRAETAP